MDLFASNPNFFSPLTYKERRAMKRAGLSIIFLVVFCASSVLASITDAPHNGTFGIHCDDCHSYSLWWRYSPASHDLQNSAAKLDYETMVDFICLKCHDGSDPSIPPMQDHSSDILGTGHGTWSTTCIDCHDPHRQGQLEWRTGFSSELFLVTGTMASVTKDSPQVGQTTIIYNDGYSPSSTWKPDSIDPQALTWTKKNSTTPDRSLIFVHDTTNALNTFSILSVDSANNTIIIKGTLDPAAVDTVTVPVDSSDTFGLIYGQLIKSQITPENPPGSSAKDVRFFNPNGGFVEEDASGSGNTSGICQVCHTKTVDPVSLDKRFQSDGTAPTGSHLAYLTNNRNCTECHYTKNGFAPSAVDHSINGYGHVTDTPLCVTTCHAAENPMVVLT